MTWWAVFLGLLLVIMGLGLYAGFRTEQVRELRYEVEQLRLDDKQRMERTLLEVRRLAWQEMAREAARWRP